MPHCERAHGGVAVRRRDEHVPGAKQRHEHRRRGRHPRREHGRRASLQLGERALVERPRGVAVAAVDVRRRRRIALQVEVGRERRSRKLRRALHRPGHSGVDNARAVAERSPRLLLGHYGSSSARAKYTPGSTVTTIPCSSGKSIRS